MIPAAVLIVAATLAGDRCAVVVSRRTAAPAVHNAAAAAATVAAPSYYVASALAYRVEDPERAALVRQNERLTEALVSALEAERQRTAALEAAGAGASIAPPRLPQTAAGILRARCAECHAGEKAKGEFRLSAKPNHAERILIANVTAAGEMPPKDRPKLTEAERKTLEEWGAVSRDELKAAARAAN